MESVFCSTTYEWCGRDRGISVFSPLGHFVTGSLRNSETLKFADHFGGTFDESRRAIPFPPF